MSSNLQIKQYSRVKPLRNPFDQNFDKEALDYAKKEKYLKEANSYLTKRYNTLKGSIRLSGIYEDIKSAGSNKHLFVSKTSNQAGNLATPYLTSREVELKARFKSKFNLVAMLSKLGDKSISTLEARVFLALLESNENRKFSKKKSERSIQEIRKLLNSKHTDYQISSAINSLVSEGLLSKNPFLSVAGKNSGAPHPKLYAPSSPSLNSDDNAIAVASILQTLGIKQGNEVYLPRRLVRYLAKKGTRATILVSLSLILRQMPYRLFRARLSHTQLSEAFHIAPDTARRAITALTAIGFLTKSRADRWFLRNRFGSLYSLSNDFIPPTMVYPNRKSRPKLNNEISTLIKNNHLSFRKTKEKYISDTYESEIRFGNGPLWGPPVRSSGRVRLGRGEFRPKGGRGLLGAIMGAAYTKGIQSKKVYGSKGLVDNSGQFQSVNRKVEAQVVVMPEENRVMRIEERIERLANVIEAKKKLIKENAPKPYLTPERAVEDRYQKELWGDKPKPSKDDYFAHLRARFGSL